MKETELVSAIVLTYNSLPYVEHTLESIKNQTYDNLELIVSDDASTDGTQEFVEKWIDDNRTRFKNAYFLKVESNTGVAANYNRAAKKVSGKWAKMIAGDDLLLASCIEDNMDYIALHPDVKVLFSKILIFFDDSDKIIEYKPAVTCGDFFELNASEQYLRLLKQENISLNPSGKFVSSKVLADYLVDERVRNIEDLQFNYLATSNGIKFHFLDKFTVKYRKHTGALTGLPGNKILSMPYVDSWIDFYYLYREQEFIKYGINRVPYEKKVLWYLFIKHILKNKGNFVTRPVCRLLRRIFGF